MNPPAPVTTTRSSLDIDKPLIEETASPAVVEGFCELVRTSPCVHRARDW